MSNLAKNLLRIRKAKKMSQAKLAQKSGVSQQLISQIENGRNSSTKELPKLAKVLEVSVADLDENFIPVATSPEEQDLLERYRRASDHRKELVRDLLRELAPEDEPPE